MHEHIGIGLVSHRAIAAPFANIGPDLLGFGAVPKGFEIIIEFAQIPHRLIISEGAARPDISMRRHVNVGDAGIAWNHLAVFL